MSGKQVTVEDGRRFGFFMIDNEVADDLDLSIFAKAAYIVLCRHANRKTEECFLLVGTVAEKMGRIADSTARKAIAELANAGYIAVEKRPGKSSIFRLLDVPRSNTADTPPCGGGHPAVLRRHNNTSLTRLSEQEQTCAAPSARAGDALSDSSQPSKHHRIETAIKQEWERRNQAAGVKCPWSPKTAGVLKNLLASTPSWDDESYQRCLTNLYASEGFALSTPPDAFLPTLTKYLGGALDRFGKLKADLGELTHTDYLKRTGYVPLKNNASADAELEKQLGWPYAMVAQRIKQTEETGKGGDCHEQTETTEQQRFRRLQPVRCGCRSIR